MKVDASSPDSLATLLLGTAGAVALFGFLYNLLFLGGAFVIGGVALMRYKRHRLAGSAAAVFGIVFSALVLFYGMGKDMALRDNALGKPAASARLTH